VWDTTTWAVAYTLEGGVDARTGRGNDRDPALPVLSVAVAGDGRYLAVGGWEAQVRVRDTGTGREHRALPVHTPTHAVAFSPDGRWLLAAGFDGVLRVWDVNSAELVAAVAEHTDKIWAMSFSPDGRSLATASADGTVRLFEFAALVPR